MNYWTIVGLQDGLSFVAYAENEDDCEAEVIVANVIGPMIDTGSLDVRAQVVFRGHHDNLLEHPIAVIIEGFDEGEDQ